MEKTDIFRLQENLKFGDLIRVFLRDEVITGFFDKIQISWTRHRVPTISYATITLMARVPAYPYNIKYLGKPTKWTYDLEKVEKVELLNHLLREDFYCWEKIKEEKKCACWNCQKQIEEKGQYHQGVLFCSEDCIKIFDKKIEDTEDYKNMNYPKDIHSPLGVGA